jgi:acylphosphatase
MPFVRKLANKLVEIQDKGKNEEVRNFLESIPEWREFVETELKTKNEIEARQLGKDSSTKTK